MLIQYKFYLEMAEACRLRDPKVMEKYIERAEDVNYDHQLDMQISLTKKILQRVREIERLTKPLLIMNQNILTEMKKYQTPHESVLHVLKATCILLGDNPKSLKVGHMSGSEIKVCHIKENSTVTKHRKNTEKKP